MTTQDEIARHFDKEAARYDFWKKKNWYYYDTLKFIAREWVPRHVRLLDAGCGTGEVIAAVSPDHAVGIDISPEMIEIAKHKYRAQLNYIFIASDIANYTSQEEFDVVLFFDVIEHLVDARPALESIAQLLAPKGRFVVTMANPLWEPVLMVGEKLGLKMPEGPHYRMPTSQFIEMCEAAGLRLTNRDWRLVFPKFVPGLSWFLNDIIGRLPLIKNLSMIEVFVFEKK